MTEIYISIGSNINRQRNIQHAVNLLEKEFSEITCSRVYESEAVGFNGDDFFNLVVTTRTTETPDVVIKILKKIEHACGRGDNQSEKKFSARTIDLDLLLFGDLILHNKNIHIPRADINQYAFVLRPMSELAPDLVHPELKVGFYHLWQEFSGNKQIEQVLFQPKLK